MLRKLLLIGAAAGAMGVMSAPAHAADNISLDTWYAFAFTSTGSPLTGGGEPGTSPNGVSAPAAPWTITLSGPATLTVTDVEISGDVFRIFDNGVLLGSTSAAVANASSVGECISCALADPNYSHGVFALGAGEHSLTGIFDGVITDGDGDFIIHSTGGVPEPASWALMLIGFGGLGAALRSRRRMARALA